jgi:protein TonB
LEQFPLPDDTNIAEHGMDDIVFEGRNKKYGAFILRKAYPKNLRNAVIIAFCSFIFSLLTPQLIKKIWQETEEEPLEYVHYNVTLLDPPSSGFKSNVAPKPKTEDPAESSENKEMEAAKNLVSSPDSKDKKDNKKDLGTDKSDSSNTDNQTGENNDNYVHTSVDQAPYFIGGEDAFQDFLSNHLVYPEKEKNNSDQGVCSVSFVVTKEGLVENVKVWRTSGFQSFNEEALRVIKLCNTKFKPALKRGKAVKSICRIDITFNLR